MSDWPLELRRRFDTWAAERRVQTSLLERWRALAAADAEPLLEIAESLRLSENQVRDFFEWTEEIALRDGVAFGDVWRMEPLRAARSLDAGRNETIASVREALRRLRFPQLVAVEQRLVNCVRALGLPPSVRLVLPPNLRDSEIRLEIRAADAGALRAAVDSLRDAMQRREFAELFALLSEAP